MKSSIDLSFLKQAAHNEQDAISSIIREVLLQMNEFPNKIQELLNINNLKEVALEVHKFKSSVQIIGAVELVNKLMELEDAAKVNGIPEANESFIHIKKILVNCYSELNSISILYTLSK